jgi:predicted N-acetyltransferase YhbS
VTDDSEQVVGGLTWLPQSKDVVYLGALVVAPSLKGRGIAGALVEDFCVRMAARGTRLVKTDFLIRRFYQAHDFHVDARWGGLVRHLGPG